VQEFISSKLYNWYKDLGQAQMQRDDITWYSNYE